MTQDEIIQMARQAGMMTRVLYLGRNLELLTEFAKLVAKHTLSNIDPSKFMSCQEVMEAARLAEREACANICETLELPDWPDKVRQPLAQAIRARGQA